MNAIFVPIYYNFIIESNCIVGSQNQKDYYRNEQSILRL